jgi:hypothetical protein
MDLTDGLDLGAEDWHGREDYEREDDGYSRSVIRRLRTPLANSFRIFEYELAAVRHAGDAVQEANAELHGATEGLMIDIGYLALKLWCSGRALVVVGGAGVLFVVSAFTATRAALSLIFLRR